MVDFDFDKLPLKNTSPAIVINHNLGEVRLCVQE